MNILQLEQEKTLLKEKLSEGYSSQAKLLFVYNFIEKVFATQNTNLIESYLLEFLPDYIRYLKAWTIFGMKPRMHELLIEQAKKINSIGLTNNSEDFSKVTTRLKNELETLNKILKGEQTGTTESKAYFPLLEEEAIKESGMTLGVIESVTINIKKSKEIDKFIIVPSEKEIEEKINEQVKQSWFNAIKVAKKYIRKTHPYHEVVINFDKKVGFCKGNSLGTALTLAFIEELLTVYNSPLSIKVGDGVVFTGGLDGRGRIANTSVEIIKQKTELIFYSDLKLFVVPKDEEEKANEKLNELKKEFPQRDLRIIGVEDLNDLLNRRNIVEIKKQPIVVRTGKFAKKNWVSAAVAVLLTIILAFLLVLDFDNNPTSVASDGQMLYIKNKNGRILWTRHLLIDKNLVNNEDYLAKFCKIVDINSDGINEVLVANEQVENNTGFNTSCYLRCYSRNEELLWQFQFNDKVSTQRAEQSRIYSVYMIDTLSISTKRTIMIFANNGLSFTSAIFSIDVRTGEKNPGTLWCSGHTYEGIIKDLNGDNRKDLICLGVDNGFEDVVLFGVEIDTINKVRPSTTDYLIKDYRTAKFITYIRIPKTDYDNFMQNRFSNIGQGSFKYLSNENRYYFILTSGYTNPTTGIWYKLKDNLMDFDLAIDNQFRVKRDSLVANGVFSLPYSDTKEYENSIKDKILYWNDGQWVKKE
jgi:sporulation protein YlmC with PRC-barrel domain